MKLHPRVRSLTLAATAAMLLTVCPLHAQTALTANTETQLRDAMFQASNDFADDGVVNNGPYTITLTASITLTRSLPMIRTDLPGGGGPGVTIDGGGLTIDANNTGRVFFVETGRVLIRNVTILNARAEGGSGGTALNASGGGGGGGLGAGAAVFADEGAEVTVRSVTVGNAASIGGSGGNGGADGGSGSTGSGGGGGLGGNGGGGSGPAGGGGGGYAGNGGGGDDGAGGGGGEFGAGGNGGFNGTSSGGGGGAGQQGNGGSAVSGGGGGGGGATANGANGTFMSPVGGAGGGAEGGPGGNQGDAGSNAALPLGGGGGGGGGGTGGAAADSGGGGGTGGTTPLAGGAGGIGGGGGGARDQAGGAGGRFGGGGATGNANFVAGGAGGFGGGGGGARANLRQTGGAGGFGAGGGGGLNAGAGGLFGGAGGAGVGADGGGGAALGGAVFVATGGALTLDDTSFGGTYTVTAGSTAGQGGATAGQAFGALGFLMTGTTLTNSVGAGLTRTLPDLVEGDGGLAKTGTGTLVLSATNTYTGATTISGGTLRITGSTSASSAVTVASGGSLAGDGTVSGSVTVNSGGTLSPGNSPGILNTGAVTVNAGGTLSIELNGTTAGTGHDQVNVTGTVSLTGDLSVASVGYPASIGDSYLIVNNDGADPVTGTFNLLAEGAKFTAGAYRFQITYVGGNGNDVALTSVQLAQSITFDALANKTLLDPAFPVSASATSLLAVSFTSQTAGVCSVSSGTVTILATGTCTIAATQIGNPTFEPALEVLRSFTIGTANQTITFAALEPRTYDDAPFAISATASSGLAVTFMALTPAACAMSGSTVVIVAPGTCTIAASQSGNGTYTAAPQVTQSFSVDKANQTITFPALGGRAPNAAPFSVTATASSGLAISFSSTTPAVCTVAGNVVAIVAAGPCTLAADQGGDTNYNAAARVTQSFALSTGSQTIAFAALPERTLGEPPFTLTATASSGLAVTFSSLSSSVCTVTGATATLVAPGTCTIAADQAGNATYSAAPQVSRSFTVASSCTTLSLAQLPAALIGIPYSQTIALGNAVAPVTWTMTGNLPAGLTFDNGVFTGRPTARGAFPIAVTATDAGGCQASASYTLAISPERRLVVGAGPGASTVRAFNLGDGTPRVDMDAFGGFTGGVSVAQGDTDGNGQPDVIVGAGSGGGPAVAIFDGGRNSARLSFLAFDPSFRGGVDVAAGDITGDDIPEILAAPQGCSASPLVRGFDGRTGTLVREYAVAPPGSTCGLHLAAGDVNGDGIAEVIVGSGGGGSPFVQIVDGSTGATLRQIAPYATGFIGGVYVAAGDVDGDGLADVVTGAGDGGSPQVRVFDGTSGSQIAGPLGSFLAYPAAFSGGVRVGAGDLNGDGRAEIITGAGFGGGPHVRVWDGATAAESYGLFAFAPTALGGTFVAGPAPAARMVIDMPVTGATLSGGSVRVAGWALRDAATNSRGTDLIHAWAVPAGGGAPRFVGGTSERTARPDVAAFLGGEFLMSGFDFTGTLAPGTYDLIVFARNSRTGRFDQARVVRITVP